MKNLVSNQRAFFASGATLPISFRRAMLRRLRTALKEWEQPLCEALAKDMHKSHAEAFLTEFSLLYTEIDLHLRKCRWWSRTKCVGTPLKLFPSHSRTVHQPHGTALIIAPWNYPVQLLVSPLIGAISAGCTAVLKPSPYTPNVSHTLAQMFGAAFDREYIALVEGDRNVNTALLEQNFDIIFFTGSPQLGRVVMRAAAEHLTPVILELGGKSPCIVTADADVDIAARRIAWGKCLNAGQTCIAPDYLLLHSAVRERFIEAFKREVRSLYGENATRNEYFVHMVNARTFDRVSGYISQGSIICGGGRDRDTLTIEPTLLDVEDMDAPVMQEEIFGPVLPVIACESDEDAVRFISGRERPLALYYFGRESRGMDVVRRTASGGACINDTIMHVVNERMPFGGTGNSGMGCYHGRHSFEAFSRRRGVLATPVWCDLPFRYAPYKWFPFIKRFL